MRHKADTETSAAFQLPAALSHRHIKASRMETHRFFHFPTGPGHHCRNTGSEGLLSQVREIDVHQAHSRPYVDTVKKRGNMVQQISTQLPSVTVPGQFIF